MEGRKERVQEMERMRHKKNGRNREEETKRGLKRNT